MIPNRIHFIFGLDPHFGHKPFSFVHYLAIRSAILVNDPEDVTVHFAYEPEGVWWEAIRPSVTSHRIPRRLNDNLHYAHRADVLRLEILGSEGGIYLDADTFCINSFAPLLVHKTVLGIEPNAGLCNAVILAEPNSDFVRAWLERYKTFDGSTWNYHSVRVPYQLALTHPWSVHVESEYSFFFPSYDDPMFEWLWRARLGIAHRAKGIVRVVENYLRHYRHGKGPTIVWPYIRHALASRQWYRARLEGAYCLHLWESLWWDRYLRDLDPEKLRRSGGLFADLVFQKVIIR